MLTFEQGYLKTYLIVFSPPATFGEQARGEAGGEVFSRAPLMYIAALVSSWPLIKDTGPSHTHNTDYVISGG